MVLIPANAVLDSWAAIAYLEDEPAAPRVEEIIIKANSLGWLLIMSMVNLGEVWYNFARKASEAKADQVVADLKELDIEFIDAGWQITRLAARFKSKYRIAYADCFAAALAKIKDAELITGDPEFKQLEGEIRIHWI